MFSFWHTIIVALIAGLWLAPQLKRRFPNVHIRKRFWVIALMLGVLFGVGFLEQEDSVTLAVKNRYPLLTSTTDDIGDATDNAAAFDVADFQNFVQPEKNTAPKVIEDLSDTSLTSGYRRYKAQPILGIGDSEYRDVAYPDRKQVTETPRYRNSSSLYENDSSSVERTANSNNIGAINRSTGEFMSPAGPGGYVGTRDGTLYAPAGPNGVTNTRTGEFIPTNR